jgi:hypothetical protein
VLAVLLLEAVLPETVRRPNQAGPKESDVLLHPVTAGDELRALLTAALGVLVTVEKRREIYYLGNVKFHVDQVSGLGGFVEIEACGEADAERSALLAQCREYMRLFHIADRDLVERSYSDLLLELNRPAEALAEYTASLRTSPNRFNSLLGASRSAELAGNSAEAQRFSTQLRQVAPNADPELLRPAKHYVAERD